MLSSASFSPTLPERLIDYGLALFRQAADAPEVDPAVLARWTAYAAALGGTTPSAPASLPLVSLLSVLQAPAPASSAPAPTPAYFHPGLLNLADDAAIHPSPTPLDAAALTSVLQDTAKKFADAWDKLDTPEQSAGQPATATLDRFLELYRAWAWAVPAPTAVPGISLYQFFKGVVALAYCAGPDAPTTPPPAQVRLVAGGIPGIQTVIYTVASSAAAKGLRGRSAYIQLLGDGVVRRLCTDWHLPAANVVYVGGGNFLLLAPAALPSALAPLQAAIDDALHQQFGGDLSLVLAEREVPTADLGTAAFAGQMAALQREVATAKRRPFQHFLATEAGYDRIFGPQDHVEATAAGCCVVCQKPLTAAEFKAPPHEGDAAGRHRCAQCLGFERLARDLGQARRVVLSQAELAETASSWQRDLWAISGWRYELRTGEAGAQDGMTFLLNQPDFWTPGADGFWLLANTTPRLTAAEAAHYTAQQDDTDDEADAFRSGAIKDFHILAEQGRGVARVGVLRMDVDNLGMLLQRGLGAATPDGPTALTLPALATLSQLLAIFFSGRLPEICHQVQATDPRERLYVIYAGGDDLFVVGSWDQAVALAAAVRADFARFTGANPQVGLSGAVTLEGATFPLYRAAERAGAAEELTKAYTRMDGHRKDAFALLGRVIGWEEFAEVQKWQTRFVDWIAPSDPQRPPVARGLVQRLLEIDELHRQTRAKAYKRARDFHQPLPRYEVHYGRWMWMLSYSLARTLTRLPAGPVRNEVAAAVKELQQGFLEKPRLIEQVGLAARWAELLVRKKEDRL